jgi:tryptophanyl-tRNA synthetase
MRTVTCTRAATRFATRTASQPALPTAEEAAEDVVTPWDVKARGPKGIDYDRVVSSFKSEMITPELLERFDRVSKKINSEATLHHFLRRQIVFSHRDLNTVLDDVESGKPFYLYTGRGPSAQSMHVGHIIPFILTKYLQDVFRCPLVIQITDDEKFLFRDVPLTTMDSVALENIKDIIAFGFDPKRTFIFRNTTYMGHMYSTVLEVQRMLTANQTKHTFGFDDSCNVGKIAFPAIQAAPCFNSSFREVLPVRTNKLRCLIPCAIDQDPFFVLTRSICDRIKRSKPALLHTKFLPALKGPAHKMSSSSAENGVIQLVDSDSDIRRKIGKAFSGGSGTIEELTTKGADLDVDVAFQFLRVFCPVDEVVERVGSMYQSGKMNSREVKEIAATTLIDDVLAKWRKARGEVTDDDVARFTTVRSILLRNE